MWKKCIFWFIWLNNCTEYLASHCWHGNCWAFQGGIFSFPLWGYSFDLCVELDALERKNKNIYIEINVCNMWFSYSYFFI